MSTLLSKRYSVVLILAMLSLFAATNAWAAPQRQIPIYTPTPLPDGRIIYYVQPGDNLISISLRTGVPQERLRALNNLSTDTIVEGTPLLLGYAGPLEVTITPGPSPTPTPLLPTPSPMPGTGEICILLFQDLNGDAFRQEEEPPLPGGYVSLSSSSGSVSKTFDTLAQDGPEDEDDEDAYCLAGMPEGAFNVSVAVPAGYNATTQNNYPLDIRAGDRAIVDFGAQANSQVEAEAPAVSGGSSNSQLLGIVGGLFLLAGIGLALFAGRLLKLKG